MDANEVQNNNEDLDRMIERATIVAIMRCKPIAKAITGHGAQPTEAIVIDAMLAEPQDCKIAQTKPRTSRSTANVLDEALEPTLWSVADAAKFLRKSPRWLFNQLNIDENQPGSIPHMRLGRTPRFIPEDMNAWVAAGFPPAATFKQWQQLGSRRKKNLN